MLSAVLLTAALALPARCGEVASLETENYVSDERSWGLIRMGYDQILRMRLKEIEGAPSNRFFPHSEVSVLDHMENGHFLKVSCGAGGALVPCPDKRSLLEARVVVAVFLEAAPKTRRIDELVRSKTFELTPQGQKTISRVEAKCPDFWDRLKKM